MGVTSLALVAGTPDDPDRYNNWLEGRLAAVSPLLLANDTWSDALMSEVFGHPWLAPVYAALPLRAASPILTNEIKTYLAASVLDDRKADRRWFWRRVAVVEYLTQEGAGMLASFGVLCLADIPHPNFASDAAVSDAGSPGHNDAVLDLYAAWYGRRHDRRRLRQTRKWLRGGEVTTGEFHAPEVQLFGDVHRHAIIDRAQMRPVAERDIILLNDLYSEDDTRFRDRQRISDQYLNFLRFAPWLRPLARAFILDKIGHGELAPATATGTMSRLRRFACFLHEEGVTGPDGIAEPFMERFLALGNARGAKGKN